MPRKYNKLSLLLIIFTILNPFGIGYVNYLYVHVPFSKLLLAIILIILLIISFIQIKRNKEKGFMLNIISSINTFFLLPISFSVYELFNLYDKNTTPSTRTSVVILFGVIVVIILAVCITKFLFSSASKNKVN